MILGFTGTRHGLTAAQQTTLRRLLYEKEPTKIVHGVCIGADRQFHVEAHKIYPQIQSEGFPSNVKGTRDPSVVCSVMHEECEPLVRNISIVRASDEIIACPQQEFEVVRSGTWACIRRARAFNKRITFIFPDGSVVTE